MTKTNAKTTDTTPAPKAVKLNDTQRRLLASAIEHNDRFLRPVDVKAPGKAIARLVTRELVVACRADTAMLVLSIDGTDRSFQITNAGLLAMNVEPTEAMGVDPALGKAKAGCMAKNYHDLYMAQGGGCADPVDLAMKDAFLTASRTVMTKKGERSEPALDVEAMAKWGRSVDLWNDKWDRLNPGMQRMNLTNRVRGALRRGTVLKLKMAQGGSKGKVVTLELGADED